jgi:Flp pilus assembly secretin CpaC
MAPGGLLNRWFTNLVHVPLNSPPAWSASMAEPRSSILIAVLLAAVSFVMPARAGTGIEVTMNQAKIVKLSRPADTIVVGNPAIADASVQDASTIVLTGKGFGVTNLVVLDQDGSPIIDEQITVVRQAASSVRIYRRAEVQTMSCTPYCESSYKSEAEKSSEAEMSVSR